MKKHIISSAEAATAATCPMCDAAELVETIETDRFPLGDELELTAEVPVLTCGACGFSFTDYRAETLRHEAVCAHQGLLTPAEIQQVRKNLDMSRREFAEAFGIPRASMDRWETGKLLQNTSLDTLLRALQNPATAVRLDRRKRSMRASQNTVVKFPTLEFSHADFRDAKARQKRFDLRACG